MNEELVVLRTDKNETDITDFNAKDLPELIHKQYEELKNLDAIIKNAMDSAEKANKSAENARNMSAGFGKKKAAIEELQMAGEDLAKAVQSGVEAQKTSFEFQTKLARISKYLFGLGVSNIASNRFVVRELEMRLKGASQEELSELARQELMTVVKQLKEQEDILRKLDNILNKIKIHDESLKVQLNRSQQIDEWMQTQDEVVKLHGEQLEIHAETDKNFREQLKAQSELIQTQARQLELHNKNTEKHDELITVLQEKNKDLSLQIKSALETIEAQVIKMNLLNDEISNLKASLDSKANKSLSIVTLAISFVSIATFVIYFFLL